MKLLKNCIILIVVGFFSSVDKIEAFTSRQPVPLFSSCGHFVCDTKVLKTPVLFSYNG